MAPNDGQQASRAFKSLQQRCVWRLGPFLRRSGKRFLKYSEENKLSEAKVHRDLILKHAEIVASVRAKDSNRSLKKSVVTEAFKKAIDVFGEGWSMTEPAKQDWIECMSVRLRNLCAVIKDNETRAKPPEWVALLPWRNLANAGELEKTEEQGQSCHRERGDLAVPIVS